jgi:glycosyltransferase involved in cell wall biosynthesis
MKFSLVLATVGRKELLALFLESLKTQTCKDFELIVVDQNKDNLIDDLIEKYRNAFSIRHIKTGELGLSHARNAGLKQAKGDLIAFPDDDCEYPERLLEDAEAFFRENEEYQILTGAVRDKKTGKMHGRMLREDCEITGGNVFQTAISIAVFIRALKEGPQRFNEDMGAGKYYGSAEDTDYIFRLLLKGARGYYSPKKIIVHHLPEADKIGPKEIQRAYSYGLGMGAFFRQHLIREKNLCLIPYFIRFFFATPAAGFFMGLPVKNKREYFRGLFWGRWTGLIRYKVLR